MYEGENDGYESPENSNDDSVAVTNEIDDSISVQSEVNEDNVTTEPSAIIDKISVDNSDNENELSIKLDDIFDQTNEKGDNVTIEHLLSTDNVAVNISEFNNNISVQPEKDNKVLEISEVHNGYKYEKYSDGALRVTGEMQHEFAGRGKYAPAPKGMENGHVVAATQNGTKAEINIVDQAKDINRHEMIKIENAEKRAVDNGWKVETERFVTPTTKGDPAAFIINDKITDENGKVNEVHFSFTNANHADMMEWEKIADEVNNSNEKSSYKNAIDAGLTGVTEEEYNALLNQTDSFSNNIRNEFENGFKTPDAGIINEANKKGESIVATDTNGKVENLAIDENKAFEVITKDLCVDLTNEQKEIHDSEARNSFKSYMTAITTEDMTVYRVYGGNSQSEGHYWTTEIPTDRMTSKTDSALAPQWGNDRTMYCKAVIPKGTEINIGEAASQKTPSGNDLPGGVIQIYLEDSSVAMIDEKDIPLSFNTNYEEFNRKASAIEEEIQNGTKVDNINDKR